VCLRRTASRLVKGCQTLFVTTIVQQWRAIDRPWGVTGDLGWRRRGTVTPEIVADFQRRVNMASSTIATKLPEGAREVLDSAAARARAIFWTENMDSSHR